MHVPHVCPHISSSLPHIFSNVSVPQRVLYQVAIEGTFENARLPHSSLEMPVCAGARDPPPPSLPRTHRETRGLRLQPALAQPTFRHCPQHSCALGRDHSLARPGCWESVHPLEGTHSPPTCSVQNSLPDVTISNVSALVH